MRTDISPNLIHFTSDSTTEAAYQRFKKIIKDGYLLGSSDKIKGGCRCVCFSEAPIQNLTSGLVNEKYYSRYSLFGFMFNKLYIFSLGGRPVIYQQETEYYALPEQLRWRHMRYEPTSEDPIDFTWEREWRVPIEKLDIHPSYTHLVLPNQSWVERLQQGHHFEEMAKIQQYSSIMSADIASRYYEQFYWYIWKLN